MAKEVVFTKKPESEPRHEFMAEADTLHRPASQIVREMMQKFVQRQREYNALLNRKVDVARSLMRASHGRSNE